MFVLVINAGSSSLKYQFFNTATGEVYCKGQADRIGIAGSNMEHKNLLKGIKQKEDMPIADHNEAIRLVVKNLLDPEIGCIKSMSEIEAVGHRIVHGGPYFSESMLLTPEVLATLEKCYDYAPLHTGAHISGIRGCLSVMPDVPQVLVFDTAFHQTMKPSAYMYALPYEFYEKYGVRRYGAHGTSHRYVSGEVAKLCGKDIKDMKIVTCHLGNGSSVTGIDGGKVVDTSMGFTPLAGVIMGTRCGDIDPAIVPYLMRKENLTPDEMDTLMNKKSGFLGITEMSSDSRDIENVVNIGPSDPNYERCALAQGILIHQCKKLIGGYAAVMNGLDAVVFTAGIGENNAGLRAQIAGDMEYLGIDFDYEANKNFKRGVVTKLSKDTSKVAVYLIPTNEELMIAKDTEAIVSAL